MKVMRRRVKRINYLNNKDLLCEIHKSKITYTDYDDIKYHEYNYIIDASDDVERGFPKAKSVTKKIVQKAKENLAIKKNDDIGDKLFENGKSNKEIQEYQKNNLITAKDIDIEELCIRKMTSDHIPTQPHKKTGEEIHIKVTFPAFMHYAYLNDKWVIVARSHYKDGEFPTMKNPKTDELVFDRDIGQISSELAKAFLLLVERIGTKPNWRGYTWLEEMKGAALLRLSQVALQFNECKSDNPFSWYTTIVNRSFTAVLNSEKDQRRAHVKLLQDQGLYSFNEQTDRELKAREAAMNESTVREIDPHDYVEQ